MQLDETLFFMINEGWSNAWLDAIMPIWRDKYTWIPLYVFFLVYAFVQYQPLKAGVFVLVLVAVVGLSDQTSSQWIKKNIQRLRPCNTTELREEINVLVPCGSGYSFTSSHATNHFAIATFIAFTLLLRRTKWQILVYLWAASIALGQVYVGVHYPLDITVGALLGILLGSLGLLLFKWVDRRFLTENPVV